MRERTRGIGEVNDVVVVAPVRLLDDGELERAESVRAKVRRSRNHPLEVQAAGAIPRGAVEVRDARMGEGAIASDRARESRDATEDPADANVHVVVFQSPSPVAVAEAIDPAVLFARHQ